MKTDKSPVNNRMSPNSLVRIIQVFLLITIFLTACASTVTQGTPPPTPTPTSVSSGGKADLAVSAAKASLAKKLNINVAAINLVEVKPVQWPDTCLGVQHRGIMCAFHVVDGYRITLSADNQTYEIHSNLDGSQIVIIPENSSASLNPADAAPVVEGFLSTMKADPSGKSSLDYLSRPLQADLQSGDLLPDMLGIQNTYASFGLLPTQPVPGTGQVLVSAGLNFVSPIYRSFALVDENGAWKINTFIVYAIPLLPPNDASQFLPADQIILEYLQALQNKDAATAWGFLSPNAQASISQANLEQEAQGFQSITPVSLTLTKNGQGHLDYTVTLWATPGKDLPAGWQAGKNIRSFTITQPDQDWQIDQITPVS